MEGIQSEIEKLLNVITVILLKLGEIENDIVSDVKLILDQSKTEVVLIQRSILEKYKQSKSFNEDVLKQDFNLSVKTEIDNNVLQEDKDDDFEVEGNSYKISHEDDNSCESEQSYKESAIKISFKKNSPKRISKSNKKKYEYERPKFTPILKKKYKECEYNVNETLYQKIRICNQCDYRITTKSEFKEHLQNIHFNTDLQDISIKEHSYILLQCNQCDFNCKEENRRYKPIMKHINAMHSYNVEKEIKEESDQCTIRRKCGNCDFIANTVPELRNHFETEHASCFSKDEMKAIEKIYQCKNCDYSTNIHSNMKRHFANYHNMISETCHICGKVVKSKYVLNEHIRTKHYVPEGQRKCETCSKFFPIDNFDLHLCEVQKFICNTCGKEYASKSGLERHIKIEHEKVEIPKPYVCDRCDYRCSQISTLKQHMKTHEEAKPCPECGVKVKNLNLHMRVAHTPDELKRFQCQDCGKGFDSKSDTESHRMNVHLKLRPYNCRYGCDISYNDTSNRNAHERKTHGKIFTTVKEEKMKARMQL